MRRGVSIVDITADQFEDPFQSVIVDTLSNWHTSFDLHPEDQQQADFEGYDKGTVATLANAYVAMADQILRPESLSVVSS